MANSAYEAILLKAFEDGETFASAQDFYEKHKGNNYFVVSNRPEPDQNPSEAELDATRDWLRKVDAAEIARLHLVYLDKWKQAA